MLKRLLFLLAMLSPAMAFAATPNITVNLVPLASSNHIVNVLLNGGNSSSYTSGIASGSNIGSITVNMSDGSFYTGAVSLVGGSATDFTATNANLRSNGSTPTCSSNTVYSFNIFAAPGPNEGGTAFTQPVTVTCVPSSSITPPAAAQVAGFTTLALNMDFTTTSAVSGLDGHTKFNAQTLSNWLDCAGSASPILMDTSVYFNQTPCSDYNVITDGSTKVLDETFSPTDYSNGYGGTQIASCDSAATTCTPAVFPVGKYVEITMRVTQNTINAYSQNLPNWNIISDPLWSWPTASSPTQSEWDFVEMSNQGGAGGCSCVGGANSSYPSFDSVSGFSGLTSYHTYGLLFTSNGTSDTAVCVYTDGTSTGCFDAGATGLNGVNDLVSNVGPQGTGQGAPSAQMDNYIQRIRIWECSGWATGQCNGTVYTSPP